MKKVSNIIQSVWMGPELGFIERLSLSSYIQNGHEVHLYLYEDTKGIPDGVIKMDANDILPEEKFYRYKKNGSPSLGSNAFRFKLLYEKGNWYADCDIILTKPLIASEPFVIVSEEVLPLNTGKMHEGSCLIKMPAGSLPSQKAYEICQNYTPENSLWGVGPRTMKKIVDMFNLHFFVKKPEFICPVPGCRFQLYAQKPSNGWNKYNTEGVFGCHVWNNMFRDAGVQDIKKILHPDSFLAKMAEKYGVE